MPGNIRVAVLEAVDLPNTVTDGKSVAVKVSVGRREYQTTAVEPQDGRTEPWNLEYLFPVLNLRDNLLVSLMDNKGDVVARAELETPQIVQKGFQDAFIALKAGGRIHIKVSFVLTDEERRKIEAMRLAALKKRKGLNNQSFRSRRAPLSNVKITEISPEEAENLETAPPKVDSIDSTPDSGDIPARKAKLDESAREQSESSPKPRPTSSPKPNLSPRSCDSPVPAADTAVSTNATCPNPNPTVSEGPSCKSDGSRHKIFNWLSRRQNDSVEGDGKFLEDLTLKTKVDKSTSVKAAKADEWIKNLDRGSDKPGICKREGSKPKKHSQEQRIHAKDSHKTVKQKLEDWREKELGPWRRTSKVRHASPPGSDGGTSWLLRAGYKPRVGKQSELQSAADTTLIESASPSPSSSPESHKKSSGGVKHLVKQVLTGAAVVAGALVLWPRKSSSKHKGRIHTVQQGETLSSIAPGEWEDPDSNFYRLNPHIRHKDAIYPGQRIRLS